VLGHEYAATFHGAGSVISDLELDLSAFPYPLDEVALQWPYAGFWSARGEQALTTTPALSADSVICFGTDNSLYGVSRLDGKRRWGYATSGHSAPIALGKAFYAYTLERGVVAIDSSSGVVNDVAAFAALAKASGTGVQFPAPATCGSTLAAAAPDGTIIVANPTATDGSTPVRFSTAAAPGDLQYAGGKVYCIAGPATALKLFICDTASAETSSLPVDTPCFAACGSRVFFIQGNQLVGIDTAKAPTDPRYRAVASSIAGNRITGLAGSENLNLLAVSTSDGHLWGLSLATLAQRWCATIPDGTADGPSTAKDYLNAATFSGTSVFARAAAAPSPRWTFPPEASWHCSSRRRR
jgi:hypothetical protein